MHNLSPKEYQGIRYLELFPKKQKDRSPLLIYLHGAGERGVDLPKVNTHGPIKEIVSGKVSAENLIVIAPQCEERKTWWDYAESFYNWLLWYIEQSFVDKSRIYLTGNSMGGYGTWAFAMSHPELFAAIVPICGGGLSWNAGMLKNTPVWAFHCVGDTIVSCQNTIEMVEGVKRYSQEDVKITIYPTCSHDAWTETYQNQEVYAWLLSQIKKSSI